jgi:hypothetical protein
MAQTKEKKEMITKKAHRATWAAMALAASFTFLFGMAPQTTAAAQTPAADNHTLSPSEVKTLIRGASTPEDHLKLAAYFKQEALDEVASAKLHVEMAEAYEPGSAAPSMFKPRSLKEMQSHCKEFARNANKAAEVASKMAAEHEKMAEMKRTAPPQGSHRSR